MVKNMNQNLQIVVCKSYFKRLKGFMFTRKIDKILCFPKCNSIHTFFMLKKIDVIMTDRDDNVLFVFNDMHASLLQIDANSL